MIVDTFWFMIVVPGGAEMILAIRAAAASTSGSQSPHAVIDLVRHSSKNSARSSLAFAGTQPSECEMKWTHSSRAGNALRYSSRLSATGSAMAWLTMPRPRLASRALDVRLDLGLDPILDVNDNDARQRSRRGRRDVMNRRALRRVRRCRRGGIRRGGCRRGRIRGRRIRRCLACQIG